MSARKGRLAPRSTGAPPWGSPDPSGSAPSGDATGAAVELRGVRQAFGELVALDGVDLQVPPHGRLAGRRRARLEAAPAALRADAAEGPAAAVAQRPGQRLPGAGEPGPVPGRGPPARAAAVPAVRSRRVRAVPAGPAVRRHAPAGRLPADAAARRRGGGAVGAPRPGRPPAPGRLRPRRPSPRGGRQPGVRGGAPDDPGGAGMRRYGPALALVAAGIAVWEAAIRLLRVPDYLLPAPSAVAAGLGLAVVLHLSGTLRRALYPILIGSQTIPIVVLAPILVILLGFDLAPKLAIVALICFFPIVVNTVDGLASVDEDLVRMMRTLDGSRWAIFKRVELPWALPTAFSGMRVAATYAAIGAVFGEWAGSSAGLGYLMLQATPNLNTPRIFAAIVILTALSLGLFLSIRGLERLLVPWARPAGRGAPVQQP